MYAELYLVEAVTEPVAKIGAANDSKQRFKHLQVGNHLTLRLAAVAVQLHNGSEMRLHEAMEKYRIRGEWFAWNDESQAAFASACERLGIDFKFLRDHGMPQADEIEAVAEAK